jgi:hypothetical protein
MILGGASMAAAIHYRTASELSKRAIPRPIGIQSSHLMACREALLLGLPLVSVESSRDALQSRVSARRSRSPGAGLGVPPVCSFFVKVTTCLVSHSLFLCAYTIWVKILSATCGY